MTSLNILTWSGKQYFPTKFSETLRSRRRSCQPSFDTEQVTSSAPWESQAKQAPAKRKSPFRFQIGGKTRSHQRHLKGRLWVKLAAWLHDVIYDSKASDNEE